MRLYHKYHRQKNPRRGELRGEKKELHDALMVSLAKVRTNPSGRLIKRGRGSGRAIDAFNLLAKLNKRIEAGQTRFIPIRDTIEAQIQGYLTRDTLDYSLTDALKGLSQAEVKVLRKLMAEEGEDISPERGKELRQEAARHPSVRREKARVAKAEAAQEEFKKLQKKHQLSTAEYLVGPERLAAMRAQQKLAAQEEREERGAGRLKKLGVPFPLEYGFFGKIDDAGGGNYQWVLTDHQGVGFMAGVSAAKNAASRDVGIAHRIVINLSNLGEKAGWDTLPSVDRRWLEDKKPNISVAVARELLKNINVKRRVSPDTARWISSAAKIKPVKMKGRDMTKEQKDMTVGEVRIIKGKGKRGSYNIYLKKRMRGKYALQVKTGTGHLSKKYVADSAEGAIRKGHMIGGMLTGAEEATRAVSNPAKIKRMDNAARKYLRQNNPIIGTEMERDPQKPGDLSPGTLASLIQVPLDNEEAFEAGRHLGVIQGIDTCGLRRLLDRRRIRKEFQRKLLAGVTGLGKGKTKKDQSSTIIY